MPRLTTLLTLIQRCESSVASKYVDLYKEHCIYFPAMLGWFVFSVLLSLYNKYVFGNDYMGFPCPLLMTSVHFLSQWGFSYAASSAFPKALGGDQVAAMSWPLFLGVAVPCALVTSGDVGFSNLALVRISISFYTMVKSSAPVFVVLSAYCFGIEKITWSLIAVVAIICMGELLTVMGEGVEFDMIGFMLCGIATVLSGMRWTVVQLKLQSLEPKLKSSIATMRILAPFMFVSMLFISLVKEQPWNKLGDWIDSFETGMRVLGLALIGAALAICMILCEFYLIMKSSAIVLMIGGVLKELLTILFGIIVFGDRLNRVNIIGCVVVFAGVVFYKISMYVKKLEIKYESLASKCSIETPSSSKDSDFDEVSEDGNSDDFEGSSTLHSRRGDSEPGQQDHSYNTVEDEYNILDNENNNKQII